MTQSCYFDEVVTSACCLACAEPGGRCASRQASWMDLWAGLVSFGSHCVPGATIGDRVPLVGRTGQSGQQAWEQVSRCCGPGGCTVRQAAEQKPR